MIEWELTANFELSSKNVEVQSTQINNPIINNTVSHKATH